MLPRGPPDTKFSLGTPKSHIGKPWNFAKLTHGPLNSYHREVLAFCRTSDRFALAPATLATHSNKSTAGLDKRTRNLPTPTAVKGPTSEMRKTSQTRNLTTGRLTTPQFFCTFPIHINWSKIALYKNLLVGYYGGPSMPALLDPVGSVKTMYRLRLEQRKTSVVAKSSGILVISAIPDGLQI